MERRSELLRDPLPLSSSELDVRRRVARRMAWLLGLAVLLLYAGGFLVAR